MRGMAQSGSERSGRIRAFAPWALATVLLLVPLLGMQFSEEMDWDETDFIVMGTLLFGACGAYELATRMTGNVAYRAAVAVAVLAALILIWINLAVGIIGSEENPANLMYGGVLAIGLISALVARFRPSGMARALAVTAAAQVAVGVIALAAGLGSSGENWPQVIFVLNGFFAALWLVSAWLFRRASRQQAEVEVVNS